MSLVTNSSLSVMTGTASLTGPEFFKCLKQLCGWHEIGLGVVLGNEVEPP